MPKATYNDRAYESFQEAVAGALVGKETYLVEFAPGTRNIQLYTETAGRPPIGIIFERLESSGTNTYSVRMIGRAASCRMIASGNIAAGAQVKGANGGTIVQANTGDNCVGTSADGLAHVANDIMEVADSYFVGF